MPLKNLEIRAEMMRRIREFFDSRGFLEVWTPILSADTIIDRFVEPIKVCDPSLPAPDRTFFLQTSPEFAMKRILLEGPKAIYQATHAFRQYDIGKLHNIEFSILEWYKCGETYAGGMTFLSELLEEIIDAKKAECVPFAEPFMEFTGLDPHTATFEKFRDFADRNRIPYPDSYGVFSHTDRSETEVECWIDLLFGEIVQPNLGKKRPCILYDYPGCQSQLARTRETTDSENRIYTISERFELFVEGIELANGYNELLDPEVFRVRNRETNELRKRDGKEPLPENSRLQKAMEEGLPPCVGAALGLDRLLMLESGARNINEVISFTVDIA